MVALPLRAVFLEDLLHRPVVELEKILTFSGMALPGRKEVIQAAHKLQQELQDTFAAYDNASFVASAVESPVIDAGRLPAQTTMCEVVSCSCFSCVECTPALCRR